MLPTSFTNRFSQIMDLKDRDLALEAQGRFSRKSAEYSKRGLIVPHVTPAIHHENSLWMIPARIESEVEAIKLLLSSGHELAYSETLAAELKQLIESRPTETWCKQLVDAYGPLKSDQRPAFDIELFKLRRNVLDKANLQIDLIVDGIKSKVVNSQSQTKEREQKFGILLGARQAQIDFDAWAHDLGPTGRSIAVFFIDIDNFKRFNTKHTETVIDETILPDAMHLINKLANHRGGAYRQGGDEFLVVLPNYDRTEASAFAEKLCLAFDSETFSVGKEIEHLTVSIGVALWPQHGQSYDDTLKRANKAKADAKRVKNMYVVPD